jgi:hypothetical protein
MDRIAQAITAREAVEVWQQFPLPVLTPASTESERANRAFLMGKRVEYNTLSATING